MTSKLLMKIQLFSIPFSTIVSSVLEFIRGKSLIRGKLIKTKNGGKATV